MAVFSDRVVAQIPAVSTRTSQSWTFTVSCPITDPLGVTMKTSSIVPTGKQQEDAGQNTSGVTKDTQSPSGVGGHVACVVSYD